MTPHRQRRLFAAGLATALLAGCASAPGERDEASLSVFEAVGDAGRAVANATGRFVKWGDYAAVSSNFLDPAGSTWELEEAWFPQQHYYLSLKMRRGYNGGAGEASQVFKRRAEEIQLRSSYRKYVIVEYSESMESSVLGAQRVAKGVIQLQNPAE